MLLPFGFCAAVTKAYIPACVRASRATTVFSAASSAAAMRAVGTMGAAAPGVVGGRGAAAFGGSLRRAPRCAPANARASGAGSRTLRSLACECVGPRGGSGSAPSSRNVETFATATPVSLESKEKEEETLILRTSDESDALLKIRHSSAHLMAQAVQKLYAGAQVTIGPWTEYGFYYDFDLTKVELEESGTFSDADLKKIRKEMIRLIKRKLPIWEEVVSIEVASERIKASGEPYKLEILESILQRDPEATITIFHNGELGDKDHWWDLCAGPHVDSTGDLNPKGLALESVSGAYWRGDEKNQMLQRVYGTAWETSAELKAYEKMKREAKKRDHRKLGQDLDLFSIQEGAGGGLVFWHPKGACVRNIVETFWRDTHMARGYDLVYSPHIAKIDLWKTSGHYDFYGENMFRSIAVDEEEYQLRPMNCPFHIQMYNNTLHSYREFPLRWAELGTVYRYERSGALHGLFRVRGFTQDDAHIFCLPSQLTSEILGVLDLTEEMLSAFGFVDYEINLSTRPEKYVGSDAIWEQSEKALQEALQMKGWDFVVDEGGGAFYGPKIDLKIKDAIGRKWQCSTLQVDFNLPERFDMEYVDEENSRQRPIMLHRAIFGSVERFFGVLVENFAGSFPLWLAPVQARVVVVSDTVKEYAEGCVQAMRAQGMRAELAGGETLGKLIRNAEVAKVPLILIVGNKEVETGTVSVRSRHQGDLGAMSVEDLVVGMAKAVADRTPY